MIGSKLFFILSYLFLCSITAYGQKVNPRRDFNDFYNTNVVNYLLPEIKGTDTTEILSFLEKPAYEPESGVRLIKSHENYFLEGRFFEKNYWEAILPQFSNKTEIPAPKMIFHSVHISNELAAKITAAFREVVNNKENKYYNMADGSSFILRYKDSGKTFTKIMLNPREGDVGYKICDTATKMAKDIKNKAFNESKYMNVDLR